MAIVATCPNCAAELTFSVATTLVRICDHCSAAVARGDQTLRSLGTVADLADSRSPLALYVDGRYGGKRYSIVGRAQIEHGAGGLWDEWYCAFDDGRWGWLAEAQGKFYMTFALPLGADAPDFQALEPGEPVSGLGGSVSLIVNEKGIATLRGAGGEIPYQLEPGRRYPFADLSGAGSTFATLDYGDAPPTLYVGKQVSLAELGLSDRLPAQEVRQTRVEALAIECPNCLGALELVAPDQAQRVACSYCGALSDVNQGNLALLEVLDRPGRKPLIPLGTSGTFRGRKLQVLGFMIRSVTNQWGMFDWDEYLLYAPEVGFRWLLCAQGHWSYVEPVDVAAVRVLTQRLAEYDGKRFKHFQSSHPRVESVQGEFYWRVTAGEVVEADDYVAPPLMLSRERSDREVIWSLGEYVPAKQIEAAFGVTLAPVYLSTVAPNQPFAHKEIFRLWGFAMLATVALVMGWYASRAERPALQTSFPLPAATTADPMVLFSEPFELREQQNIQIRLNAPVSNSWVYVTGDLVSEETGLVQEFAAPIEYYFGNSDGQQWSEGSPSTAVYLSAAPKGSYLLRLAVEREKWREDSQLSASVREGVARHRYALGLLLGICLIPGLVFWRQRVFEAKRWAESDYA